MPWTVEQPFETWRAIAAHLRRMPQEHDQRVGAMIDAMLDQTPADRYDVTLTFSDEDYYRSVFPSGVRLGLRLPVER
jgi:hypothetical protein